MAAGKPQKQAVAIALNTQRKNRAAGGLVRRDMGGNLDPQVPGGLAPSAATANPMFQQTLQRYTQLPPEKLQELAARFPPETQQGQMIQRALRQKQMTATQQQPMLAPQQARGGVPHLDIGGVPFSMASPWWTRREESQSSGLLHSPFGAAGGRSDTLPHAVAANSYIIPADVVSGFGEGDTLSGARVIDAMLNTMPYGVRQPPRGGRGSLPHPPRPVEEHAAGGRTEKVPVLVANGEYHVSPEKVRQIGGGNYKKGHAVLDALVHRVRERTIKQLQKLPPPAK